MRRTYHLSLVKRLALTLSLALLAAMVGLAVLAPHPVAHAVDTLNTLPTSTPRPTADTSPATVTPLPEGAIRVPVRQPTRITSPGGAAGGPGGAPGGRCVVVVTPDDFVQEGSLRVIEVPREQLMHLDANLIYMRACEVEYRDANGNFIQAFQFNQPIEVCFPFTDADLAQAQGSPERLTILAYDPFRQVWVELPLTLDVSGRSLCAQLPGSGLVALAIKPPRVVNLPDTSGNLLEGTPTPTAAAAPAGVAPPAAPAPAATQPAPTAPSASAPAPIAPAPIAQAPVAQAGAPASGILSGGEADPGPLSYLPFGLLVAAAVAAVIVVLSRNFVRREREE
jgi:hypothetical protein